MFKIPYKKIISLPYQLAHAFRVLLFDLGISKRKKLGAYVVSVGNMSFGGTGKTPFTIALAKYLSKESNLKVAILTRGYKAKLKDFPKILNPNNLSKDDLQTISPSLIGDEPYMMLQEFIKFYEENNKEICLVVDPSRYRGGSEILKKHDIDVFILDDGMQHIQLERDLNIVIENTNEDGFYRELPWALNKADLLVYSKVDDNWVQKHPNKPYMRYKLSLSEPLEPNKGVLAFSAIGDSKSFFKMLEAHLKDLEKNSPGQNLTPFRSKSFPDHHSFTLSEVMTLVESGMNLICTRKDYIKIPDQYKKEFVVADLILEFSPVDLLGEIKGRVIDERRNDVEPR